MSKRFLIGLLAVSVVAMWGSDANAFNRILNVAIKHRQWVAEVTLSGFEQDSLLTLVGRTVVEFICEKERGPTILEKQKVNLNVTKQLASFDFNQTVVTLILDQISCVQCPPPFTKVEDSELIVEFDATTAWKRCNGVEPGPDEMADNNSCFEFNGTDETTVTIEALQTSNCGPGVREEGGSVPPQTLSCTTEQVGPEGIPPAPPPEPCGNGIVESGEQCDGENLNGQTCATQGFDGGKLTCSAECTFDTSGCLIE
jgi:hypothetical protein